jgi:3',5'-cyclic AMP phosphodiesterase CpdA
MRLALIADTHWGIRSDHNAFLDNSKLFLDQVFFPTLEKENINTIIHLGDLVDHRKYINMHTAYRLRQDFIDPIMERMYDFHWILGNHDIFWRNTTQVSIASEMYGYLSRDKNKFHYYIDPTEVEFDGKKKKILFLPWICESNRELTTSMVNSTDAKVCFGHLELAGFEMYKGLVQNEGENPSVYDKFDLVCTGHYHHKSHQGNVHYLGAHGEFVWSDCHGDRGFHIFDCEDNSLTFIKNPFNMFEKVYYNDVAEKVSSIYPAALKGKIVKVIVRSRTDSDRYNNFMVECEKAQPMELIVVEDHLNLDQIADKNIVSESKTTLEIIREYVSASNNIVDTAALNKLITSLYNEASSI